MCKQVGLDADDIEDMTVGMCVDYIEEYVYQQDPNRDKNESKRSRNARQSDFDSF